MLNNYSLSRNLILRCIRRNNMYQHEQHLEQINQIFNISSFVVVKFYGIALNDKRVFFILIASHITGELLFTLMIAQLAKII